MNTDELNNLRKKIKTQSFDDFFVQIDQKFSNLSWYEKIQKQIIHRTLKSSKRKAENQWDDILTDLLENSNTNEQCRFAAHFAMLLML